MIRKFTLIVCGFVAAAFSLPSAYLNAAASFHGEASVLAGCGAVAVVVFGMAIGPEVFKAFKRQDGTRALLGLPVWLFCFGFTLVNSISFISGNRGDVVAQKTEVIAQHERANADIARLSADLELAKTSDMWNASSACAAVTRKTKAFCDHVSELNTGIRRASVAAETAVPSTADAQATFFTRVGLSPAVASWAMPAWFVVAIELVAMTSFIFAATEDSTVPVKKSVKRKKRKAPRPRGTPALKVVSNG
jgi:hypothetical protein